MTTVCGHCDGPTRLETVVELSRGRFGMRRETWEARYCPGCLSSVPDPDQTKSMSAAIDFEAPGRSNVWLSWLRPKARMGTRSQLPG